MFIRTRKYLTLTLLISGLLLVTLARAETKGAKTGDVDEIDIETVDVTPTPTTRTNPAPVKTNTPAPVKKISPYTATPTPVKIIPPTPTKTPTPLPVKAVSKPVTPTPTPGKISGESRGSQFSLSLDLLGQGLFLSKPYQSNSAYFGGGGEAFVDWRPIQYLSLGIGGQYSYFPQTGSFGLGTVDAGGRIFPLPIGTTPGGELYLQGGLGLNLLRQQPERGHYHGYAGVGYRLSLSQNMALDTGAQYDFYSPLKSPTNGIGAKVGLTFLLGRTQWPNQVETDQDTGSDENIPNNYLAGSLYLWQAGDTLRAVSEKIFGDPTLFSLLVDANKDLFINASQVRIGTKLVIPPYNLSDEELDAYREKSLHVAFYVNLERLSGKFGYEQVAHWNGPTRYLWRKDDDMLSVAQKIYGDEDLFPILVDANEKRLIHPANLKPGVVLIVPAPPAGNWVDVVHQWGWSIDSYMWWKEVSEGSDQKTPVPQP